MGSHSHHQANVQHTQSTVYVCTLWDPISSIITVKIIVLSICSALALHGYGIPYIAHIYCTLCMLCIDLMVAMGSHKLHTYIVPCVCCALT